MRFPRPPKLCFALVVLATLVAAFAGDAPKSSDLPSRYRDWLDQEVVYIISNYEREGFLALADDPSRDAFIRLFWEVRDPTPGTSENEFKVEHLKRVAEANRLFRSGGKNSGWKTPRGKVYIQLGAPRDRVAHPMESRLYPIERWFYQGDPSIGMPPFFNVVFYQPYGVGDYELYEPSIDGPEKLVGGDPSGMDRHEALRQLGHVSPELQVASLSLIPTEPVDLDLGIAAPSSMRLMGRLHDINNRQPFDRTYVERVASGEADVSVEYSFKQLGMRAYFHGAWSPDGLPMLHYAIEIPPENLTLSNYDGKISGALEIVGRVFEAEGKAPMLQLDERVDLAMTPDQLVRVQRFPFSFVDMVPLLPGSYRASLVVRNLVSREFGIIDGKFEIPERPTNNLGLSAPLLVRQRQPAPVGRPLVPFVVGDEVFSPAFGNTVSSRTDLDIIVQVTYPTANYAIGDEVILEARLAAAPNDDLISTQRAPTNPVFDHGLLRVPLRLALNAVAAAPHELRITATGKGTHAASRSTTIQLTPRPESPPWVYVNRRALGVGDIAMTLAGQHLLRGDEDAAIAAFRDAAISPNTELPARQRLGELLITRGEFAPALAALTPLLTSAPNTYTLMLLGIARSAAGDGPGAIQAYQRAVDRSPRSSQIMNLLAEEWLRAGNTEPAILLLRQSLGVRADQPEISELLAKLEKASEPVTAP